ncbi:MAG: hypothetical protein CMG00_03185 [Candidatus Marinimicrobia bacterium]|nr:hypothetical protein [Candidatus Neomarinimicrobiota bacterium]|tara:strand:- start:2798 stop:3304 length:507 start_codon:yes stop_codon:yes gene_type:complete
MTYVFTFSGKYAKINRTDLLIGKNYEKYLNHKIIRDAKHPTTDDMLAKNIDNDSNDDPAYFGQDVYNHVNKILQELEIKNESPSLPQDREIKSMQGFQYIEFEVEIKCSFEKFGKFVTRLEKSNKIFIIDRFELSNGITRGVQRAKSKGKFPEKDITMRIWAINLNKG